MSLGNVHNYYEKLVIDCLRRSVTERELTLSRNHFEDIICIALNQLPPHYVRFSIDTTFYLSSKELQQIQAAVEHAVDYAIKFILQENQALASRQSLD